MPETTQIPQTAEQPDATEFPLTGQVWRADYGELVIEHDYRVARKLSFVNRHGTRLTVDLTVAPIRDDVFMLTFQDDDASVVAVEDLSAHTVYSTMILRDHTLLHMSGTLTRVDP